LVTLAAAVRAEGRLLENLLWDPNLETLSLARLPLCLPNNSKSFSLIDCISVGVDRMQRNFEPMRKQVETWQQSELTDVTAKVVV
jgi:hypothetical protein